MITLQQISSDMKSLLGHNTRRPDITITNKGCITITARVARALSLESGDVIDIVELHGDYYLRRRLRGADVIGGHECAGRYYTGSWRTWSARLARSFRNRLAPGSCETLRFPCGEQTTATGEVLVPIITRCRL